MSEPTDENDQASSSTGTAQANGTAPVNGTLTVNGTTMPSQQPQQANYRIATFGFGKMPEHRAQVHEPVDDFTLIVSKQRIRESHGQGSVYLCASLYSTRADHEVVAAIPEGWGASGFGRPRRPHEEHGVLVFEYGRSTEVVVDAVGHYCWVFRLWYMNDPRTQPVFLGNVEWFFEVVDMDGQGAYAAYGNE